jgi:hypothetical protein
MGDSFKAFADSWHLYRDACLYYGIKFNNDDMYTDKGRELVKKYKEELNKED